MKEGIVDSMVLMHYENGHGQAIDWWETKVEEGWRLHLSMITCMERLKGVAGLPGDRQSTLSAFKSRIQQMKRDGKIFRIYPVTREICKGAYQLIEQYCQRDTPSPRRNRMEALICDMLIAATALRYHLVLFTQNLNDYQWISGLNVEAANYEIEEDESS